ncbi:MAG: TetR/AcrR family transcriptional regulator [Myxococcales bacterium]|nr:TetR/AcrR family transcriptional regulator [Myxococcales bacterium]
MTLRTKKSTPKRSGTYHHGNLRQALIDATLEVIDEVGHRNLSLRDVARRAGVSTAAPYRHFASREALLAQVAEEGYRMMSESIEGAIAACDGDSLDRLREVGVGYVLFANANRARYAVMFSEELVDKSAYPATEAAAARSFAYLLEGIRACQAEGRIVPDDPRRVALAAWSAIHGLSSLISAGQLPIVHGERLSIAELARYVGGVLLSGVATGGRSGVDRLGRGRSAPDVAPSTGEE